MTARTSGRTRRPKWRALRSGLGGVVAPVIACTVALLGLSAWTTGGWAGRPARAAVSGGRIFLPFGGGNATTAAFFRLTNTGTRADELVSVSSTSARTVMLARTVESGNAGQMRMGVSLSLPATRSVVMSPSTTDIMFTTSRPLRLGERVTFVLHFRHAGPVRAEATVVRPGT